MNVRVTGTGHSLPTDRGDKLAFTGLPQYLLVAGLGLVLIGILVTRLALPARKR